MRLFSAHIELFKLSLMLLGILSAELSYTQVITVTTNLDVVDSDDNLISLREAITLSNTLAGRDTITFDPTLNGNSFLLDIGSSDEDINADGDLDITDVAGLVILGNGISAITIDGNNSERIFDHFSGDLTISDLTIQNGYFISNGSEAVYGGAGIRSRPSESATILLRNTYFSDCHSKHRGGAFYLHNDQSDAIEIYFDSCTFQSNLAENFFLTATGGAVHCDASEAQITFKDCQFVDNKAEGGGAIYFEDSKSATILRSIFKANFSGVNNNEDGGAVYIGPNSQEVLLRFCSLDSNVATLGGGVYVEGTSHQIGIEQSVLNRNMSGKDGGALYSNSMANIHILNSTLSGNIATRDGGAIALNDSESLTLNFVTMADNLANHGNSMGGDGGAINLIGANSPSVEISNSIVQGNEAIGVSANEDCANSGGTGSYTSLGGNVFGDVTGCPVGAQDTTGLALLDSLQNNGGFTSTRSWGYHSAAQNFAICDTTSMDQRGALRDGPCDAGAFEAQAFELPNCIFVSTALDSLDGDTSSIVQLISSPGADGKISLREAVTAANNTPGLDQICFAEELNGNTIYLDIPSTDEELNLDGDLDVRDSMGLIIIGNGKDQTIIDGAADGRVLEVHFGSLSISRLTIRNGEGSTDLRGAGINVLSSAGSLCVDHCKISGNVGRSGAGIRFRSRDTLEVKNSTLENNQAIFGDGGGLLADGTNCHTILDSCHFIGNYSQINGGGASFIATDGSTILFHCTFRENECNKFGGGVHSNASQGTMTIQNCEFSRNIAETGGGIAERASETNTRVINTTISGNQAVENGGGINIGFSTDGNIQLHYVTISQNVADADTTMVGNGGGINIDESTARVQISNSIIQNNYDHTPGQDNANDCANTGGGTYLSLGGNVFGPGTGCPITAMDTTGLALLDTLAANGGPTKTHALPIGSAAIGFATCDTILRDQRGQLREGPCDAGSFERQVCELPDCIYVTTALDVVDGDTSSIVHLISTPGSDGKISLREAITATNNSPGLNHIQFVEEIDGDTIYLDIPSTDEDLNHDGDLDLLDSMGLTITGNGRDLTIIDGAADGRVIEMHFGSLRISDLTLQNADGATDLRGGGIYAHSAAGSLTVDSCKISENEAMFGAGILFTSKETLLLKNSDLTNNHSLTGDGGGLYANGTDSHVIVDSCHFESNSAASSGGGFSCTAAHSTVVIRHSSFKDNQCENKGGGVHSNGSNGSMAIFDTEISGNKADEGGGLAERSTAANTRLVNTTISGNRALESGGGVYIGSATNGTVLLHFATIYQNVADSDTTMVGDGGGIDLDQSNATVQISNSIIQNNSDLTPGQDITDDCANTAGGTYLSSGGNVFGSGTGCPITVNDTTGSAILDTLSDNGGLTRTHALLEGSAAIDFATCDTITLDQRGLLRSLGGSSCDAGAYEGVFSTGRNWIGVIDSNWEEHDNWAEKSIPTIINAVSVGDAPNFPVIEGDIIAKAGSLIIDANGQITVAEDGTLEIGSLGNPLEVLNSGLLIIYMGGILETQF